MATNVDELQTEKLRPLGLMSGRKLSNCGRLKSSNDDDKLEHCSRMMTTWMCCATKKPYFRFYTNRVLCRHPERLQLFRLVLQCHRKLCSPLKYWHYSSREAADENVETAADVAVFGCECCWFECFLLSFVAVELRHSSERSGQTKFGSDAREISQDNCDDWVD